MKKIILTILIGLTCICAFGLTVCSGGDNGGETPPIHTHDYKTLKFDSYYHWYECECGDKSNKIAHNLVNNLCVCGYEKIEEHTHDYKTLKFDNDNHWYECECGDKSNKIAHNLVNNLCVCGYEKIEEHTHDYKTLKFDSYYHWYECECGDKKYIENHKGGMATTTQKAKCSVCNKEYGNFEKEPTEGLEFSLINNDTEYEVYDYIGTSTEVYIPSTHNDKPVTSIGYGAFEYCSSLQSIEIPDSVTSIGEGAFAVCESLTSIEIGNGVTSIGAHAFDCISLKEIEVGKDNPNYKSIDGNLYSKNGLTLIKYAIGKSVTTFMIPNGVANISENAFSGCDSLTSIVIPDSMRYINNHAFSECFKLVEVINKSKRITITKGSSMDNGGIGFSALSISNCDDNYVTKVSTDENGFVIYTDGQEKILVNYVGSKTNITIPKGVTKINSHAFERYSSLTSVTISDSVTDIGYAAFHGCSSLQSIEIPDSVTSIGWATFSNCDSLTTIYCEAKSQPSGWDSDWNEDCLAQVVWGYKGEI